MEKYLYYSTSLVEANSLLKIPTEELQIRRVRIPLFKNRHSFEWKLSSLLGGGFYEEYQLLKNGNIVCNSEVANWMPSFPFMSYKGIYIGSCRTVPTERGRGYYPYLICKIKESLPNHVFYMFVDEGNDASIRGVTKAGFHRYALLKKTKFGFYKIKEKLN